MIYFNKYLHVISNQTTSFFFQVDDILSNSLTKTVKTYKEGTDYADDWDNIQTWVTFHLLCPFVCSSVCVI